MAEEKVKPAAKPEPKAEPEKKEPMAAAPAMEKPAKKSSPEALMTSESPKKAGDAKSAGKSKGGGFTETRVQHHNHGGHHVHHVHKDGSDKDVHYAAQDLEGVKAGLDQHIGGGAGQVMNAAEEPPMSPEPAAAQAAPPAGAMPQAAPQV